MLKEVLKYLGYALLIGVALIVFIMLMRIAFIVIMV